MIDPTSIGGVLEGLRTAVGLAKTAADAAVDVKVKEAIFQIRETLYELQERALNDQQSRMELMSKLDQVRNELAAERDKKARLAGYQLVQLDQGAFAYRSTSPDKVMHHACPDCYVKDNVTILQSRPAANGSTLWRCQSCDWQMYTGGH